MVDFEKEFEERLNKGLKIIEDYFEEHWGSDTHLKYAKGIFDIWAVSEAKRYECINTKGTYFKQMSKNEKTKALEFNDLLEQEFKDYAKELVKKYQKKYPIVESKKSTRKSLKESMNLDYSDFDYKKFENWIIRYLEDYGCEVNTVEIICDDYGYDVEINIENAENLPSHISDKDYGAFIFDAMYTTNCLYLKMPIVRAMKIAEEFSPKVLKVNDDSILIGDKNSDTEIWLDVWTDNDGDEDYIEWDYNQQSFNLNNYEDMVQKYLQQIDDFFYILDGEVSDNF